MEIALAFLLLFVAASWLLKRKFGAPKPGRVEPRLDDNRALVPKPELGQGPAAITGPPKGDFRFIALDVETANGWNGSICQIGLACVRHDGEIEAFGTLVDPGCPFESFNTRLHGIDAAAVKGMPTFSAVLEDLAPLLSRHTIVQHSNFDRGAIGAACREVGAPAPDWSWVDSVKIARLAWPELTGNGGHGLANLKSHLSLQFRHHDAVEDARAAALVVLGAEAHTGTPFHALLAPSRRPSARRAKPVVAAGDEGAPLAGHIAVFTGALTISREHAARLAALGGITVAANVTLKTTLLIVGDQDIRAGDAKSSKHRKAEEYAARGGPIRIIGETEFFHLLDAAARPEPYA